VNRLRRLQLRRWLPEHLTRGSELKVAVALDGMARATQQLIVSAELALEGRGAVNAVLGPGILHGEVGVDRGQHWAASRIKSLMPQKLHSAMDRCGSPIGA